MKDGVWRRGKERWRLAVAEAPQSWQRLLSPLLSEAILEARAAAEKSAAKPLALVIAPNLSASMHDRLAAFAARVAPEESWIAADLHGRAYFHLPAGVDVRAAPVLPLPQGAARPVKEVALFSDLHQWMIKVLLAPHFEERLLNAPRRPIRSARALADVAQVSVPAAARFVRALDKAGHLDRRFGDLRIAEPVKLLERWRAVLHESMRQEIGARFVRGAPDEPGFELLLSLASAASELSGWHLALGLFDACRALELGHVKGGPRHLYVSRFEARQLENLGLVAVPNGERADVILRVPRFPEAVFRAAPRVKGALVADVIQCWLDVSNHPARGEEQADFLWRRVIAPALESR